MIRMGFFGPTRGDPALFERRVVSLASREGCSRIHYLGDDDALEDASRACARILGLGTATGYDGMAFELARTGDADALERFLRADEALSRLTACRALPKPPARTLEMLEDRILVMVFDKSRLDEDDIVNADIVVYGKSDTPLLRKIGPRLFFSPGPASSGYGVATLLDSGTLTFACFDDGSERFLEETLAPRSARFSVSS